MKHTQQAHYIVRLENPSMCLCCPFAGVIRIRTEAGERVLLSCARQMCDNHLLIPNPGPHQTIIEGEGRVKEAGEP